MEPSKSAGPVAVDIPEPLNTPVRSAALQEEDRPLPTVPAWHGTLLPKTDADIWLVTAFAEYEKIVAREHALRAYREPQGGHEHGLTSDDRDRLAVELFAHRSDYLAGARAGGDTVLAKTHADLARSDWYRVATGKGVLILNELRRLLGPAAFEEAMDSFGRQHAGKEVTSAQFKAHLENAAVKPLTEFFDYWLQQPGLPVIRLGKVMLIWNGSHCTVEGEILRDERVPAISVDVTLTTDKGQETKRIVLDAPQTSFRFATADRPQRLVVDPYGATAKRDGGVFSVLSFHTELEHTLIVYGTADEAAANRETAESLQHAIIARHSNYTVPIKTDREVTESDLRTHHLLLIGRPDSNPLVDRCRTALPITFGSRSFTVRNDTYAHAGSAVVAAAVNPLNTRYSLVVLAGLSAASTFHVAEAWLKGNHASGEVVVLPNKGKPRSLVVPARELVHSFEPTSIRSAQKAIDSLREK